MTAPVVAIARLSTLHTVQDKMEVSAIRLQAVAMARAHGFDASAIDRLETVVTQMGRNITGHAGTGQIILRTVGEHATGCIEILALDKGPGIADLPRAMRATPSDGVRRDGGIAEIRRAADLFDLYSQPGHGTAVVVHISAQSAQDLESRDREAIRHGSVGVVCVPLRGEEECGDGWAVDVSPGRVTAMLVDGLGHGPGAAVAAVAALARFRQAPGEPPEAMLRAVDIALHETRGAALSIAVIDKVKRTIRFCGVGNVDGRIVTADSNRHLVPQNGIVGHTMPRMHCDDVPWPTGARLVLHSDGISSRWQADRYPGLLARHPSLIAGVLFRDGRRERDDATVLVLRDTIPVRAA